eukprot:1184171-Prorocentrum_minimum.AAC.3
MSVTDERGWGRGGRGRLVLPAAQRGASRPVDHPCRGPLLLSACEFASHASGSVAQVSGSGAALDSDYRFQGGMEQWVVSCPCRTEDDDGERMVACDTCGVWQHTRCMGIPDHEAVPARFACRKCAKAQQQQQQQQQAGRLDT